VWARAILLPVFSTIHQKVADKKPISRQYIGSPGCKASARNLANFLPIYARTRQEMYTDLSIETSFQIDNFADNFTAGSATAAAAARR
jgi:hypothetical protein